MGERICYDEEEYGDGEGCGRVRRKDCITKSRTEMHREYRLLEHIQLPGSRS